MTQTKSDIPLSNNKFTLVLNFSSPLNQLSGSLIQWQSYYFRLQISVQERFLTWTFLDAGRLFDQLGSYFLNTALFTDGERY